MPGLLIKDLPDEIHYKLKSRAERNRRSMTKEALVLLEQALNLGEMPETPPTPVQGAFLLTDAWLDEAKAEGRP